MRTILLTVGILLLPVAAGEGFPQTEEAWAQGQQLMREAYRLREEGNEEAARERMALALALFRRDAAERTSLTFRPEVDLEIEETPYGVNLIENRSLFKIEFRTGPPPSREEPPPPETPLDAEAILRLQQLIVQNLARVIQDNAELKASVARLEENSRETESIGDLVAEIRADTADMSDLAQNVSDIRDRSDEIYDGIDRLAGDTDTLRAVEDLAGEISDLRDAIDLLRDILDIVQDIRDDTQGIKDLESQIDDVKSEVQSLQN